MGNAITLIRVERKTVPHKVTGQPMPLLCVTALDIPSMASLEPIKDAEGNLVAIPSELDLLFKEPAWATLGNWTGVPRACESIMDHLIRK